MHVSSITVRRLRCAAALAVVVVGGIVSRSAPLGWPLYDKSLGDVLYAVAAYLGLALLLPRVPLGFIAAGGAAACFAVEFMKLSDFNARLLTVPVLRWFLGTTFSWHNIVCYLLGIAVGCGADAFFLRRVRR
ncbi:MAG TPA: DUF2809 domain-containing protein [Gemmataceae bacterium]|nr:DUF2809 domain-containing protein [Gemmataceae bacterium]